MPIEFRCPQCGKLLRTPDNSAGKKGKCPHCQTVNDIPLASTAASTPSPAAPTPAPKAPSSSGGDLFANLPGATPTPAPTSPVDLFGQTPSSTPAPGTGSPDLFANLPGSTPAPAAGNDLFANLPGASTPAAPTDLFGGSGSSAGSTPAPMDKAQALFADPFGPGVGGGGGSTYGGGGDMGGGGYSSAQASNPYGAPSYAASQPSYGGGYQSGMQPHRAGMVLALGIFALVSAIGGVAGSCCCCLLLPLDLVALAVGIPAAVLGHIDLKKMKEGIMDPSGQGMTMTGYIMGIVSCVLVLLGVVLFIIALVFNIGVQGMQGMQQNQNIRF